MAWVKCHISGTISSHMKHKIRKLTVNCWKFGLWLSLKEETSNITF